MVKSIVLEGVVTYDVHTDMYRIGGNLLDDYIGDFDERKVIITITEI